MAGTPIGKIDAKITATGANGNQEFFKNLYDFFEQMVTANYATRIAIQYGSSGTGTDYHDGTDPFGENAFAVYRMDGATSGNTSSDRDGVTLPDFDYYVMFQWADTDTFGSSPGNPGVIDDGTGDGVGIVMAVRDDGTSPWNGSTNNNGTDTKGSTVWTDGTSTVHVIPIANENSSGKYSTNKEATRGLADVASTHRVSLIGTADSILILVDAGDDGSYVCHYLGIYEPLSGLSPSLPLCAVLPSATITIPWTDGTDTRWPTPNVSAGYAYNGADSHEAGVLGISLTEGATSLSLGQTIAGILDSTVSQPNTETATAELDGFPIRIIQRGQDRNGYVGDLESGLVDVVYNVDTHSTDAAKVRAYFGNATKAAIHFSVPWDGTTTPGTTSTRAGVTF